ncbi:MAG: MarR family transcriptional regulator [Anaerolineaceae bacterium]|nr:MarR family transcriptional regulator [Anaerolineaceae bacterium]
MGDPTYNCAYEVLDVIPSIMRAIRHEMRRYRGLDLSIPQFRTLTFINNHPGISLSTLADHLGLTSPSACRMIDLLVGRDLVLRQASTKDRRQINLSLTEKGQSILETSRNGTMGHLAVIFSSLTPIEQSKIINVMQILRPLFANQQYIEPIQSGGNINIYADSEN